MANPSARKGLVQRSTNDIRLAPPACSMAPERPRTDISLAQRGPWSPGRHVPRKVAILPRALCGILLQFGTRAEFLSNITFKHPGFCTYSCCSSPVAPWHRARPEVWARVAPSSSQKSLAGQRAQRGSVWAGHTSTTALSGASLSPGHQCASMQTEARLRSATL